MAGLIATRAQLREYLERARGKRHCVNSGRILLIHSDMDSLSGYSDVLGELITSHLLSGREPEKPGPRGGIRPARYGLRSSVGDEPDVTLTNLEEPQPDVPVVSDTPAIPNVQHTFTTEETMDYTSFVANVKESLREQLIQEGKREMAWSDYTRGNGRRAAAKNFFNLLIAATKHEVEVAQHQPWPTFLYHCVISCMYSVLLLTKTVVGTSHDLE